MKPKHIIDDPTSVQKGYFLTYCGERTAPELSFRDANLAIAQLQMNGDTKVCEKCREKLIEILKTSE